MHRGHFVHSLELVAQQNQLSSVDTAEGAGEARQVGVDSVRDLASVEDTYTRTAWTARVAGVSEGVGGLGPDTALGVNADAVRA